MDSEHANGLSDGNLEEILLPANSSAASQAYLTHLTTLPLPTLLAEPAVLQTQSHHLTSSLTSLTHTSYPTFLSLHQTTSSLSTSLASLESSLDNLLTTSLPALEDSAAGWRERTEKVLLDRRKARVVLEQHDKIRDLLEIPMLIDTCVRNGYFAEALSLASHARSLSAGTATSPLIVTSVLSEVQNSITQMLLSLLATLHEPNRKLPALWKAVNFLRKMDMFGSSSEEGQHSEEQIALAFLGGREGCLKASLEGNSRDILRLVGGSGLAERDKEDMARFLKKYIEVWREGVYDIIAQFTTIFLERPPSSTPKTPTTPSAPISSLHPLLTTYTTHALTTHLLPLLSQTLPLLPISTLPSLLTQLTYCATAFARVGMDFRGVLGGLFCTAVASAVGGELKVAGAKWAEKVMNALGDASPLSPTLSSNSNAPRKVKLTLPSQWIIAASLVASPPKPSPSTPPGAAHVPPQVLASYPPLAEHTNALLGVLNGLRLLAPVEILAELLAVLDGVLDQGGDALLSYARRVCEEGKDQDEKVIVAAGEVYFGVFVPFMRRFSVFHQKTMDAQRLVRARVLAVVIFATSVLYQIYAFVTQPARLEDLVYAPHPYFLMAFVAIQIGLQFCWIVQMFHSNEPSDAFPLDIRDVDSDRALEPAQMAYVPYFVISNICIVPPVASTLAWGWDHPILSQVFTVSNAACQLYFVFFALHSSGKYEWTQKTRLTHLVAKSSAGVAVLYMWRAWGVLDINSWRPALQQQVHCGVLFLLLAFASGPDPTLGLCLLLDLVALAAGNTKEEWRFAFFCIIGVLFVVVLSDWMLAWKNRYAPRTSPIDPEDEESAFHESPFQDEILMSDLRVENPAIESGRS
ncbi:Dor1-like family-domain-containing protein [Mycena rosella]|uniref:Conserved oligomeric Golgi complex subunit 8 n=1 Tax=Mycena rosella TaxID=1033263 RepID=A0AAD7CSK1_MYCRO|nr:Dor1-like family-domain-containing protein [Mycena rosella]